MDLDLDEHSILFDENGRPVEGDTPNIVIIINNNNGSVYAMEKTEAFPLFNIKTVPEPEPTSKLVDPSNERNLWSEEETLALIGEYKSQQKKFRSSTIRNSVVWQEIASNLKTHTATQCENSFKYLKNQYIKKVESLGPKNTDGTFIRFPFFDHFEEIFGNKPNIQPKALASSSQESTPIIEERKRKPDEDDSSSEDTKPKKRSQLQKQLEDMEKRSEARERAIEQRHKENLKRKDDALQLLSTFCNTITSLLNKKHDDQQ